MKRIKSRHATGIFPVFIFAAVFVLGACVSAAEPGGWAHEGSDLAPDPRVRWGRLENGFRYAILANRQPPGRTAIRLLVRAGSLMETEEQRGLAHFLEHMAFNGTKNFSAASMIKYFQRLGIAFGADINAYTGFEETVYKLELPSPDPGLLVDALRLFRDYADGLLLQEEEIEKERGVILSEKRARDSAGHRTRLARLSFLFPEALLSRRDVIGLEEVIATAPRRLFADFYAAWYRPERLVLAVVGDLDPAACEALIREQFGSLAKPAAAGREPDLGRVTTGGLRAGVHIEPEASGVGVAIFMQKPYAGAADSRAERARQLRLHLAQRLIALRLDRLRQEPDCPFTSAAAYSYDWLRFVSTAAVSLDVPAAGWRRALELAVSEIRRALVHGFTQAEIDELRAGVRRDYERAVETAPTRQSGELVDELVAGISRGSVFTAPELDLELANTVLAAFTPTLAAEVFRGIWDTPDIQVFVSGCLEPGVSAAEVAGLYRQAFSAPVSAPAVAATAVFAYAGEWPPGEVVSSVFHEDLGITQLRLANGVRVNLKPTDFEANAIHLRARCGSGRLELPAALAGLPPLAERAFVQGGLGRHDHNALRQILAGRDAGIDFAVHDDALILGGRTTARDLILQLQLLRAYLLDPGMRVEAFELARREIRKDYLGLRQAPTGIYSLEVLRFLASGDHRVGMPSEAAVLAVTPEACAGWLRPILGAGYLEVSLVGDFSLPETVAAVRSVLGTMPPRAAVKEVPPAARELVFPQPSGRRTFSYATEIPRALVAVTWPTADIWDISRSRRLDLLAGLIQERLRVRAREDLGAVYSVHVMSKPSDTYRGYGFLGAISMVLPERAELVAGLFHTVAAEIAASGVDADEFERVLKPRLSGIAEQLRKNQYWLNTVLAASQEAPQRLEWARSLQSDYAAATAAELRELAARFTAAGSGLEVFVMPTTPAQAPAAGGGQAAGK